MPAALADQAAQCSWEDGTSTILGAFGNVASAENVGYPSPVHSGDRALKLVESPESGTPQAYLAFVENLEDGDVVEACFWAYDDTPSTPPSVRIWAHYAGASGIGSHEGTASGNTSYTPGNGWSEVCHEWTFERAGGRRDALVLEVRLYSPPGQPSEFYIDDISVRVSSSKTKITLACGAGPPTTRRSSWGDVKALYR